MKVMRVVVGSMMAQGPLPKGRLERERAESTDEEFGPVRTRRRAGRDGKKATRLWRRDRARVV